MGDKILPKAAQSLPLQRGEGRGCPEAAVLIGGQLAGKGVDCDGISWSWGEGWGVDTAVTGRAHVTGVCSVPLAAPFSTFASIMSI